MHHRWYRPCAGWHWQSGHHGKRHVHREQHLQRGERHRSRQQLRHPGQLHPRSPSGRIASL
ncbi:hypothetical protein XI04_05950 [Bradyrhizobium sp. CCBAU 11430]|nr:hypothetical protein [Bradyrhizobium sp. CCBAU 21359]MDA9480172.1 hypothetical protein [Bradyrhizobium sp. CCBAU 65884]MDA9512604.1 hypothetical protein [Bradyrhizobium sp. CCBAU 11430]